MAFGGKMHDAIEAIGREQFADEGGIANIAFVESHVAAVDHVRDIGEVTRIGECVENNDCFRGARGRGAPEIGADDSSAPGNQPSCLVRIWLPNSSSNWPASMSDSKVPASVQRPFTKPYSSSLP